MEALMDEYLSIPEPEVFDFWDWLALGFRFDPEESDRELYNGIMSGALMPDFTPTF